MYNTHIYNYSIFTCIHKFGECSQQTLNPGPGHLNKLAGKYGVAILPANCRTQQYLFALDLISHHSWTVFTFYIGTNAILCKNNVITALYFKLR